ncbi:DUF6192 family protein [Streptomyces sp. NPDC048324]|uniref:DUF6192 family protein n=1 Tax=Streptomyces sp. NPDC048324 TaxID=3157205 RepID=UPI0034218CAE
MTRRKLIPMVWYCKYCYQRQPIDIGPDGSLIICTVCGYGLAPLEEVFAAGSMRTWWEGICDEFYAEAAAYRVKAHRDTGARFMLGDLALDAVPLNDPFTGRKLSDYAKAVGLTPKAMSQYRRVAAAWPEAQRSQEASWSVHAILASHPDRFNIVKHPPHGERWRCADAHAVMDALHTHAAGSQARKRSRTPDTAPPHPGCGP